MKNKNILLVMIIFLCAAVTGTAQNWVLTGNGNAANNSKLGTTTAVPLRLFTNNALRVYIASGG